jgi:hypothetical protein
MHLTGSDPEIPAHSPIQRQQFLPFGRAPPPDAYRRMRQRAAPTEDQPGPVGEIPRPLPGIPAPLSATEISTADPAARA